MTQPPIEQVFGRAWRLLTANPILIVPGLVIGAIVGILAGLLVPPASYDPATATLGQSFGRLSAGLILGAVGIVAAIANEAYTVGMAGAAWASGRATFADGAASFREDAGRIAVTAIGLFVLGLVAVALSIPTIGLALLAYWLFTLYAMPAAILGNRPGFSSISASFRIASRRFVPTMILGVMIVVIGLVVTLVTLPLRFVPVVGPLIGACVTQAVIAYATLVVVGEYLASDEPQP